MSIANVFKILGIIVSILFFALTLEAVYLFTGCFLFGSFLSSFIKEEGKTGWQPLVPFAIGFMSFLGSHNYDKIDRLYNEKKSFPFDKFMETSKPKPHRVIFAYDNSGAYLDDTSINETLLKVYYSRIKDSHPGLPDDVPKPMNYKNLLIARLCYDLINTYENNMDKKDFKCWTIGDPNKNANSKNWRTINKANVKTTIDELYLGKKSVDLITNLTDLYKNLRDNTDNNQYSYTLFLYSDFVHDLGEKDLENDTVDINKLQQELLNNREDLVQNIFYVPINKILEKKKRNIREEEALMLPNSSIYTNLFDIDQDISSVPPPHKIIKEDNLTFYGYSNKSKYSASLRFKLNNNEEYYIYLRDHKDDLSVLDGVYKYIEGNSVKNEIINLTWNRTEGKTPTFDIVHKGVHYRVECKYDNYFDYSLKWIIPFVLFLLGIIMAIPTLLRKITLLKKN